jgi:hypothetical protein
LPFDPSDDPFDPSDDPFDPSDDPFDPSDDPFDPPDDPFDPPDDPFDPSDDPFDPSDDPSDPCLDPSLPRDASPSDDFEPLSPPPWLSLPDLLEGFPAPDFSLAGSSREPAGSDLPSFIPSSWDPRESGSSVSLD